MSENFQIIRIAARGDGVTADGQHAAGGVPGDVLRPDGTLKHGPHHIAPACQYFGQCGGCQLQHADEDALRQFVTERVTFQAEKHGFSIGELLPTHLSPPKTRRRATLHALRTARGAALGFREGSSYKIVDLKECHILRPELAELLPKLRQFVARHGGKRPVDIDLTLADQGVDCSIKHLELEGLEATEAALEFAQSNGLARLTLDQGYGAETQWEPQPVTITLSGRPVGMPPGGFLQATQDGEDALVADAKAWIGDAVSVADLFSGLGTFAFALASPAKVLAAEAARDAHLACKAASAGLPMAAMHRDLFRNPLQPDELNRFEAVLLDPPRAGAKEQVGQIAASSVNCVVYISCNPVSWARDCTKLIEAGFNLEKLRPVGQFRWSTHVELASYWTRG
ncbi:MAG: class I SAM-dependent RNA methyltransferase [Proteobacteria bacterium]|jgi:23S rRNA (uracil1939-C5)-methyltransferase|nr:class I SAM-dependent RNA methyltransferase [Pseudomonadota bacterium]MDA0914215.1 class I SAM-dependent RNA methyltransferase [Pseudomonadota bacterium]MDA1032902.1 class I SAM-dependent RNA methyltransferase [Pseudomonadota bacterium]